MRIEEEIRQKSFSSPQQKAVINLIFTANWLLNKQQEMFKPYGITPQQFNILRILKGSYPKGISGTEIKTRMLDKNSDVSRLIDRLVSKGLAERKSCPSDKRATDVFITTDGLDLLRQLWSMQSNFDQLIGLDDADATVLSTLLDQARG